MASNFPVSPCPASLSPNCRYAQPSALEPPTPYRIRAEYLLGPAGGAEEEVDEGNVSEQYLFGLLALQHRRVNSEEKPEQQAELAIAGQDNAEEGTTEVSVLPPETMFLSSFGMSFCVSSDTKALESTAAWGQYRRQDSQIRFKEDGSPKKV